jgi:HD-GYP domain-containing protein (c-di-GMP phosphodiesterase class II)
LGTDGNQDRIPRKSDMQGSTPYQRALATYIAVLVTCASALGVGLAVAGYDLASPVVVLVLACATAVAERWSVPISANTELSVYLLPTVFAAVVLGPLPAAVVAACSMLGDPEIFRRGRPGRSPRLKWATYTCTSFITGALAGLAASSLQHGHEVTLGATVAATFAAMAVAETVDLLFATITTQLRGRSMRSLARGVAPVVLTSFLVYAPVVVGLALAYLRISPWTIALFVGPTLALQRLYTLYQRERRLTDDLRTANETLERANLSFAAALIATLDARDRYTAGHSAAVAIYSRDIASRMGLSPEIQERVYLCGLVHDIGKIGLPAGLLEKPGALTLDERRQMQEHSGIGERILQHVDDYADIALVVRHHHERIDGEGYPDGLRGDGIPLLSRIIAVADAYNAMTSDRPYRDAMPSRVARLRLAQAVETQFDTAAVAAFEAILAGSSEDYRQARRKDFRFVLEDEIGAYVDSSEVVAGAA